MGTKVTELRQPTGTGRRHDPHCRACGVPTPCGEIAASDLWEWCKRQQMPVLPFRSQRQRREGCLTDA